ncbi:DNA topoisomerase 2-binding protein 1-A [Dorcoceras hygrometricum]|uniref:DNA topoisomerase 2-binding protein 1-A n=1 Tax=Dorcoceras hygrometricum TaxID=472368 RepID=A0A2Z7B241_9LAMI|nr:DNA topoisomerase 2-binding protein 1-A [Dorcoceras hygrometricum]
MAAKVFAGINAFMSRNLVPPELFDAVHDALKLNGAQVILCCDPSRNGPNDYHVIASSEHEKFEDLRSKGCKMLGPQCVLLCAKERRSLPNQGFTCCLAMDGVNILVSGFDKFEKVDIMKMVTAMGGVLLAKASSDVSFVIAKNVLAQKYKWAVNSLKKPVVTLNWLVQCWKEHRVVPQESYRVLPFSGLTICVSGIPADERKEIEKLVIQNNGTPEGDKYKVAKRWGHIHIVTRKWFHQSVGRRACLIEDSYPVLGGSASSVSTIKTAEQYCLGKVIRNSQYASSSLATASDSDANLSTQDTEPDLETPQLAMHSTFSEALPFSRKEDRSPGHQQRNDSVFDHCVADDSQSEDDDLYLSECRILLVGFESSEMRKLVDMVRRGGGSRYMYFSEKLTHLVVGNPSETEMKEVRSLAANGVIHVVKTAWLEDCTRTKKEVPLLHRHIAHDLLLPKDPVFFDKKTATRIAGMKQGNFASVQHVGGDKIQENSAPQSEVVLAKGDADLKLQSDVNDVVKLGKSSAVFEGKLFCFSGSFPEEQRPEVLQWVEYGGGEVAGDQNKMSVHFIVERHGAVPHMTDVRCTYVSSHWIHSCIEDGRLLDVGSHVLYSPLPCQIPLPGFEGYRFCVSRYDTKERQLLRNLCYVLGVKFVEKLTKKATHLICKYADGDKYEAACRWGIQVVTAEWIYGCVLQNKFVDPKTFYPKEPTSLDREAGLSTVSQYPSQSVRMLSEDDASQTMTQDLTNTQKVVSNKCLAWDGVNPLNNYSKRPKVLGKDNIKIPLSCVSTDDKSVNMKKPMENSMEICTPGASLVVPDVAAAIEDLLEQTIKIQDPKSQETSGCNENILSSNSTMLGQRSSIHHSDAIPSQHWVNRSNEGEDNLSGNAAVKGSHDGFSETQTDSQVVGYEEDLSGRQMIIERVRIRSIA